MSIYSQDLREKVMAAVAQDKQSNRAIAETVGISESTIEKWARRKRERAWAPPRMRVGWRVLAPHETLAGGR
jgi:transposase